MLVYAGLEGGGTKSQICLGLAEGPALAHIEAGSASLSRYSPAVVRATLGEALQSGLVQCGSRPEDLAGLCGGFASAGTQATVYSELLRQLAPRARQRIMSDAELTWHAASGGKDGIVVIAGTGSIVWGCFQGRTRRVGGQGPGRDPGSGDAIGRAAVAAGLIAAPCSDQYAALVPALAADPSAAALFNQAGEALAAQVRECAEQLAWPRPTVYYWGGILEHIPVVLESLQSAWGHALCPVRQPPVLAALDLARHLAD